MAVQSQTAQSFVVQGTVSGSVTIQGQPVAGGLTFQLPSLAQGAPSLLGQMLVVTGVSGGNNQVLSLGFATPAAAPTNILLSSLAQDGATTGQVIEWNGTAWAPGSISSGVTSFNGRAGVVLPLANDYNFNQLAGSLAVSQINSKQGNGNAVQLTNSGAVTAGDVVTYDVHGNTLDSGTLLTSLATTAALANYLPLTGGTLTGDLTTESVFIHGNGNGEAIMQIYTGTAGSPASTEAINIDVNGNLEILLGLKDHTGSLGTNGYVLSTTGTQVTWVPASSFNGTYSGSTGISLTDNSVTGIAITENGSGGIQLTSAGSFGVTVGTSSISIATGTGNVNVSGGSAGSISIGNAGGEISISSAGSTVINATGTNSVEITTATGAFQFFGTGGGMQLATGNGSIAISSSGAVTIGAAGGSGFSIATGGGAITVSGVLSAPSIQSTTNINVFGSITDGNTSTGAAGQVLTSTVSGVSWHSLLTNPAGTPPVLTADNHVASGTITINGTTPVPVTLSGAAQFSAGTTYVVHVSYNSVPGGAQTGVLYVTSQSASGFNITSTDATDTTSTIAWTATGY